MRQYNKLLFLLLFVVNALFFLFRSGNDRISGDEAASYVSVAPFLHGLFEGKVLPTFLVFFHEPLFQVLSAIMIFFGASQWLVRFPNTLSGILLFIVLYKIGRLLFGEKIFFIFSLLILYTFNEFTLHYLRPGINVGVFNLILAISFYYLIKYEKNRRFTDLLIGYKLFLVNFFVYIDIAFSIPGLVFSFIKSKADWRTLFKKEIMVPGLISGFIVVAWFVCVYAASTISQLFRWETQAPFKLISRGMSYSLSAINENIALFTQPNSLALMVITFICLIFSIIDKRARLAWSLLAGPLIYFNIVKMPTIHLTFFWILILVVSVLGMRMLVEKIPIAKYIIFLILIVSIVKNIQGIAWINPFTYDNYYKVAATYIRKVTQPCEYVYTDDRWNVFQLYFNRKYITKMSDDINYAVIVNKSNISKLTDFGLLSNVKKPDKTFIYILKKGYTGDEIELNQIDGRLFNFQNTLTYVNNCLL